MSTNDRPEIDTSRGVLPSLIHMVQSSGDGLGERSKPTHTGAAGEVTLAHQRPGRLDRLLAWWLRFGEREQIR